MKHPPGPWTKTIIRGFGLAGAAGVAHFGIAASDWWFSGGGSLPAALVGTLFFSITLLVVNSLSAHAFPLVDQGVLKHAAEFGVGLVACLTVYYLTIRAVGNADTFYCHSVVPWGIWIAACGAFMSELLLETVRRTRHQGTLEPAVYLSLFWISPFYGFFKAPVFLAQGLQLGCESRENGELIVAGIGMWLSAYVGRSLAGWLDNRPRKND